MKTTVKIGLGGALIWIILNLAVFLMGYSREFFTIGILINIFALICTIAVGIFLSRKEDGFVQTPFLKDFKEAMQAGLIYTVIVSGFIYVYHEKIDPSIRQNLINNYTVALHNDVPDEETFIKKYGTDEKWADSSYNDFIETQEDAFDSMFSSFSVFFFHLLGLFLFSFFYSFFAVLILRKVVLRR